MSDIVPRRRVLVASAAALPLLLGAAGCRSSDAFAGPDPLAGRPPLGHDVLTLQAVIAAEENMIDLYRAAISGDSGTSPARLLRSLLAQHEQHLVQLTARLVVPPGARGPGGAGGKGFPPGAGGSGGSSPRANTVSTARLRAAERASAADLVQRLATVPPALAQLFASIAASDATHVTALGGWGRAGMVATTGVVPALQGALAAENAAIFGYGVAGAFLTGSSRATAEQAWTGHNRARDTLAAMISARGATPAAAQAFYQLPFRVHNASSAARLAAYLEDGVTRAYLGLVAVSDPRLRQFGAMAMQGAARRAASWRGNTQAFPGLSDP